ncbi:MAG: hypothetical protein ACAH80_17095 [Alphaproteobacteria bacterium]
MSDKNFFKDNFVLIVGLALPVLLMIGFMVASSLPQSGEPPKYDLVFYTNDYRNNNASPVSVNLTVKNGQLVAQYNKLKGENNYGTYWPTIYMFDAKTQRVRKLDFGLPKDADKITGMQENAVESTKSLKLSTEVRSPDGYELGNGYYRHRGLFNEVFFGWGGSSSDTSISNGSRNIKLSPDNNNNYFYGGQAVFLGWVTP